MNTSSPIHHPVTASTPGTVQLLLSPRVPLVKLDTVVAARGQHADTVTAQVDRGVLRWVFNMANHDSGNRDLRFWIREVTLFAARQNAEHANLRKAAVPSVLNEILGDREEFRSGEVCLLLGIRRPSFKLVRDELITGGRPGISRQNLEQFLIRRLLR